MLRQLSASDRLLARTLCHHHHRLLRPLLWRAFSTLFEDASTPDRRKDTNQAMYRIPHHNRLKVITAEDAASLVHDSDTITCSGFVSQGAPEAVLKSLGERYRTTGHPHSLCTSAVLSFLDVSPHDANGSGLLFGGGPGDWNERGLNHLGQTKPDAPPMLFRTIGSHYGQTPKVAELALSELTEAWSLPLGSISRMIRSQATHSPGHLTNVGLGTFVDPDLVGGAINEKAKQSSLELVSKLDIQGETLLMYKALPINVAIIRGTTADSQGNISLEHESLVRVRIAVLLPITVSIRSMLVG